MSQPRVLLMKGGQVLSEHPLPAGAEIVVGRSDGCDVTIADGSVSRLHARLVADCEGVYVEDLGSANGTFVDGTRVRGRARLEGGQEVRVAQRAQAAPFVLRVEDERQPKVDESTKTGQLRERWARFPPRSEGDGEGELLPPVPPTPAPNQPLWRMGAPDAAPLHTVRVSSADHPSAPARAASDATPVRAVRATPPPTPVAFPPPTTAAASSPPAPTARRKSWIWAVAASASLGVLTVAAVVAWWLVASRRSHGDVRSASNATAVAVPTLTPRPPVPASTEAAVATAGPAPSPAAEVLVVPTEVETTTVTRVGAEAAPSPAEASARPLAGKWAARLENVFYPEDDYVIELRLDLQQRGGEVSGNGRITIEGKAMTFGVPATTVSGTVRRGPPPWAVSLRLPFGRPIGELQLEGTLDGDALAGTFRSSAAKQPGAWHAVRSQS